MIVKLTPGECRFATYVGINRRQAAIHALSPEPHGTPPAVWDADVEGAAESMTDMAPERTRR